MWVELRARRTRYLGRAAILGIVRDVSERKRLERELQTSVQVFQAFVNPAPVMMWMTEEHHRARLFNDRWLEFTVHTLEQELAVERTGNDIHPDDRAACLATYNRHFKTHSRFVHPYRLQNRHVEYRWIEEVSVPRYAANGRFEFDDLEDATTVAGKLLEALARPFHLNGQEVRTSGSIGISIYPQDAKTAEDLVQAADAEMYAAKQQGRGCYACYTQEVTERSSEYLAAERELLRALLRGNLSLHYQPVVNFAVCSVLTVEALIRLQHPQKGLVGASQVIPTAEGSSLFAEIDEWGLHLACAQSLEWLAAGLPLCVAVNTSPREVRPDRLALMVERALKDFGLPAARLEIDITEEALQHEEDCIATLQRLKEPGVSLTIDDFGSGWCCLAALKHLPLDRVKIDSAFVRNLPLDASDAAIANAIIALAHQLDLRFTAEGLETGDQLRLVRERGCDDAQGHLLSQAVPPESIPSLLGEGIAVQP